MTLNISNCVLTLPKCKITQSIRACALCLWTGLGLLSTANLSLAQTPTATAEKAPEAITENIPKAAPEKTPEPTATDPLAALSQIDELQKQLDALDTGLAAEVQQAKESKAETLADLQQRQNLAQQFIFNPKIRQNLQQKTAQGQLKLQQNAAPNANKEALKILNPVVVEYRKLIKQYALIEQTITAQKRAELTRADSKMYYTMDMHSTLPAKVLKAYGIMELAKQQRDQGQFAQALAQWDQAEILVRESFNEYIASMTKWREDALRDAEVEKQKIRVKVEALLKDSMLDIPAGDFLMGSNQESSDEAPVHKVHINAFKLNSTEVTFELYDLCVASSNCFYVPPDEKWGRANRPVTNVSYHDITDQFLPWLNKLTNREYRLPSEAEWEYAARAGTSTEYFWGNNVTCDLARFDGGNSSVCYTKDAKNRGTFPVKSFKPNSFGLFDMHGNVWEWVEDCWHPSYENAPSDGSAWVEGNCEIRVMRGGAWDYPSNGMRSANRYYFAQQIRRNNYGFRLALSVKP